MHRTAALPLFTMLDCGRRLITSGKVESR